MQLPNPKWFIPAVIVITLLFGAIVCYAEDLWKITAYCACSKCCGKTDGIMASGKKVYPGAIACNWLPFGTKVKIEGIGIFTVEDRGAKSLFGTKTNHIKHIDIYMPTHREALKFGVRWLKVEVK